MNEKETRPRGARPLVGNQTDGRRRFDVDELLGSQREAILVHNGEDYRLRITARGRLILTK